MTRPLSDLPAPPGLRSQPNQLVGTRTNRTTSHHSYHAVTAMLLQSYLLTLLYGARFLTESYTRGCHWFPRMLA
jgi:hypothetical protein